MKIYVLSHCTNSGNYNPRVYTNIEEVEERLETIYTSLIKYYKKNLIDLNSSYLSKDKLHSVIRYINSSYFDNYDITEIDLDLSWREQFYMDYGSSSLDKECEQNGVNETIESLIREGLTDRQLEELHFDLSDIRSVREQLKK